MTVRALSSTARNMAAFRALETAKPRAMRLFADPFAVRFLGRCERALVGASRVSRLRRWVERYADGRAPGARLSAIARTRLIDDVLLQEIAAGAGQIVILGAGFDCRALRLPELARAKVFEVDRPAMVRAKDLGLADIVAPHVQRVPVDFARDNLAGCLLAAGYSPGLPSVFLWEGVTNYLDEESVGEVFDFVAANAPASSKIVFTYVHASAIAGTFDAPGLPALLAALAAHGEPWTFGFVPEALRLPGETGSATAD
ncbi:MAG: SAM-dependent methyltransferase [Alphaproteobacteria bacterium]